MRVRFLGSIAYLVPLLALALGIAVRVADPGPIEQSRELVFDAYQRLKPRQQDIAESPVRIIDIDEESLRRFGQWPWPRTYLADMTRKLGEAGAAVIAFDIVFAEPDRLSPSQVVKIWPQNEETRMMMLSVMRLPDHDRLFAETLAKVNAVTGFVIAAAGGRAPALKAGFGVSGPAPLAAIRGGRGAIATLDVLEEAAKGNGALNWLPSRDQVVRRVPTVMRFDDQLYPSLFAEILRVAQGAGSYKLRGTPGGDGVAAIQIGRAEPPVDREGQLLLYFAPRDPKRTIPAWQVMHDTFDPKSVEGRIVIFGTSAIGLFDIRATPLDPATPGVEVHAQAIEQVVAGIYLNRPDFADGIEILYLAVLSILVILAVPRLGAAYAGIVWIAGITLALGGSWLAFTRWQWMLDGLYPALGVTVVFLLSTLAVYLRSDRERRQVRSAFGRYLAPTLVERLAADPSRLKLGGEMRDMTLLFSDVRGFTALSEKFDAQGLTAFMNRYLTPMTDAILSARGTVDKYMGDAIMAFWNAPIDDPDHAKHACRAALEMTRRLAALNAELQAEARARADTFPAVDIGIGLNTALCCVGNMGSQQRFDYSVLGDGVNLASRLEGQTKEYGVTIILGESTRRAVPGFAAVEIDLIRVKGKSEPTRIYALLGDEAYAATDEFHAANEAQSAFLAAWRAGEWDGAEAALIAMKTVAGGRLARLARHYEERLAELRRDPPGPAWDGVYVARSK